MTSPAFSCFSFPSCPSERLLLPRNSIPRHSDGVKIGNGIASASAFPSATWERGNFRARVLVFFLLLLAAPLSVRAQTNDAVSPVPTPPVAATETPGADLAPMAPSVDPGGSAAIPTPTPDLRDIRALIVFPNYTLWILLGGLVIILLILAWHWFANRPARLAQNAYDQTLDKLARARALLREEEPMPYAVLVSETIRHYLGQRFRSPSTRRTTEEFLRLMENDPATPLAAHRELLREFLQSCDLVKFARYQPTLHELEQVHQGAVNFVLATQPPAPGRRNGAHP